MDHRQLDQRLAAGGRPLVVLAQPPAAAQPGERPLHHPAHGITSNASAPGRFDDLQPERSRARSARTHSAIPPL